MCDGSTFIDESATTHVIDIVIWSKLYLYSRLHILVVGGKKKHGGNTEDKRFFKNE